jgi:hypothetical protein
MKELTAYVQCRNDNAHSLPCFVAQGAGATIVHQGGTMVAAAHPSAEELAEAERV